MNNVSKFPPLNNEPTCESCKFCKIGEVDPNTLKSMFNCLRDPPVTHPIPTQGGLAMSTTFPIVTKNMFCFKYEEVARILN